MLTKEVGRVNASHPTRRKILFYKNSRQSLLGIGRLFLMSGINIDCNGHKHCDKSKDICPCYHKHHPFRKARIGMEARPPTSHENTLCTKKPLVRQDQGGFLLFIKNLNRFIQTSPSAPRPFRGSGRGGFLSAPECTAWVRI